MKRVSVAEAKNKLPALLHEAAETGPIEICRRNEPVAVIVAHHEFERMRRAREDTAGTWQRVMEWRRKYSSSLDEMDVAGALRGGSRRRAERPARRVKW